MNLPADIVSLLQDEAYAVLCQESLTDALAKISREKAEILSTRPPFGMLASTESRQTFQTSLRSAIDNEVGLRNRIDQLTEIDGWLKGAIEKALQSYLSTASPEFRCCHEAVKVVTHWEATVEALLELSLALARDAHAVAAAINPIPLPNAHKPSPALVDQARIRALGNLRITVVSMHAGLAEVQAVREEFAKLCDAGADGLQLPEPPEFRSIGWVDKVASLPGGQATSECDRFEKDARAFCADGIKHLLRQSEEVREACVDAGRGILAQYWRTLRAHAQTHFVKERDLDEVIAELTQHRLAAEVMRHQSSFEAANVSSLR